METAKILQNGLQYTAKNNLKIQEQQNKWKSDCPIIYSKQIKSNCIGRGDGQGGGTQGGRVKIRISLEKKIVRNHQG